MSKVLLVILVHDEDFPWVHFTDFVGVNCKLDDLVAIEDNLLDQWASFSGAKKEWKNVVAATLTRMGFTWEFRSSVPPSIPACDAAKVITLGGG